MNRIKKYEPEIYGIIIFAFLLNLWYLSASAIDNSVIPKSYDMVIKFLIPVMSGFIGAFSAFKLKEKDEIKKNNNREISSLNRGLFCFSRQINALAIIKKELDEYIDDPARAINLPANQSPDHSLLALNIEDLDFLLDDNEANLLMDISLSQDRFNLALWSYSFRNKYHLNEFQKKLEEINLEQGGQYSEAALITEIGERIYMTLTNQTNELYENIPNFLYNLEATQKRFYNYACDLYPEYPFTIYKLENSKLDS